MRAIRNAASRFGLARPSSFLPNAVRQYAVLLSILKSLPVSMESAMKLSSQPYIHPAVVLVLGFALLPLGCYRAPQNNCEVSGTITYKGKNLTKGTILFRSADMKDAEEGGKFGAAEIKEDGTYVIHSLEPGKMVVTIETPHKIELKLSKGTRAPPGFDTQGASVQIPAKYADAKKSGLYFEVQPGNQTKDWPLD